MATGKFEPTREDETSTEDGGGIMGDQGKVFVGRRP